MIEETPESIARHYAACMDSVNLISGGKPSFMSQGQWDDAVRRNKEHLELMLKKPYWTTEDLTPLREAVK